MVSRKGGYRGDPLVRGVDASSVEASSAQKAQVRASAEAPTPIKQFFRRIIVLAVFPTMGAPEDPARLPRNPIYIKFQLAVSLRRSRLLTRAASSVFCPAHEPYSFLIAGHSEVAAADSLSMKKGSYHPQPDSRGQPRRGP